MRILARQLEDLAAAANVDPDNPPPDTNGAEPERDVAVRALEHADTPTLAYFDSLGRTFLTVADNGTDGAGNPKKFRTRIVLDIEGNQREVIDAKDRIVMRYDYDLLGNRIHQHSMEAGQRWMLNDVAGKPIRAWNSRGPTVRTEYDPLRRPLRIKVTGANPDAPGEVVLTERLDGEQHPSAELLNLRGKPYLQLDQAGAATNEENDFKGNPVRAGRKRN